MGFVRTGGGQCLQLLLDNVGAKPEEIYLKTAAARDIFVILKGTSHFSFRNVQMLHVGIIPMVELLAVCTGCDPVGCWAAPLPIHF